MRVIVQQDDGTEVDVTEEVKVAYDCVRQSLDWGSGFLDVEEVDAIIRLSAACAFPDFEEVIRDVWADREAARQNAARREALRGTGGMGAYAEHIGVWKLREQATAADLAAFRESVLRRGA